MLTLSCALCASLTMLIQQAVHYSALQQSQITQSEQSKANGTEKDKTASTQTTPSQQPSTEPDSQSEPTSGPAEPADPADGLLNINAAGSDELQTLKGVGPVTAQRIIDYRNQIGRFDNVDQLLEVKGIGEKTLAKFRGQVCAR
ncbi:ComEA family DNA-binding protein [Bifidobacterium pseudocatenulatum]|nr:ComEA family DNA-binding protein [Bifidobacterium pseudocatenulatum]MZM95647.1 ComEA family DNA-binding protein [Bifidobacterium pseudocatenulatum]MZN02432.1 ComEA family DNA-binding protein [Bifidobacterium pseudocatenulatum]MZN12839.1 ComEA family DNA-binding protein [Bifidobacterium pseudocatenulatum]MZN26429.1 ComEA family DNA-binding protein [Bifidobacterium pseudocatenulatum]